jgi:hypothetical protein
VHFDDECCESWPVSSVYIWSENSSPKSEARQFDKNNRKGLELTSNSSFNFRHLGKECAEISYFDFD